MAGAGYKLFNTGDVLTAAQVNTYLMQQTVMVFASSAARTSALSGVLAEGMVSYLQDTNTLEVYDGSSWVGATGDITGLTAGTGISISSATGPVPTVTNSMATEITAKGDLIVGTGSGTFDNLAAGSSGDTLVADSAASTGLRWQGNYSGGKNFLINGGFDIWQRATSSGSAGYQTADRWYENATNSTTFAQETTTIQDTDRYAFKMTAGATAQMWIQQPIETLNATALAGRTVAVSVSVRASTTVGMTINVYSSTTVDNTAAGSWGSAITATSGGTGNAVSGSWTRISGTYAIPSNAKSVMVQIITTSTVSSGVIVYLSQAQLEIGSVPTAFTRAGGTIQSELAACKRYLPSYRGQYNQIWGAGHSTTGAQYTIPFDVEARVKPTGITISTAGDFTIINTSFATGAATSVTFNQAGVNSATINSAHTAGSPTIAKNEPVAIQLSGANAVILFTGCEL